MGKKRCKLIKILIKKSSLSHRWKLTSCKFADGDQIPFSAIKVRLIIFNRKEKSFHSKYTKTNYRSIKAIINIQEVQR